MKRTSRTKLLLLPAIFLSGGCAYSPTVDVLGSYFPAWMACIIIGLVLTLIVRLLLIGSGIYPYLRYKTLVFPGMLIFFTLAVWLAFFKN
jgi:protein AaeX